MDELKGLRRICYISYVPSYSSMLQNSNKWFTL